MQREVAGKMDAIRRAEVVRTIGAISHPGGGKPLCVLSLSGTQRTDWAVSLLVLLAAAFGLGALAGRLSAGDRTQR
jgi:hypothetical protein